MATTACRRPLSLLKREEISRGLAEGLEQKQIAERIGRCPSIVSREIRRHGGRERTLREAGQALRDIKVKIRVGASVATAP